MTEPRLAAARLLAAIQKMATVRAVGCSGKTEDWREHLEPIIMEPYDKLDKILRRSNDSLSTSRESD